MSLLTKKKQGTGISTKVGTGLVVLVLFFVFAFSVYWFRKPNTEPNDRIESIANIMTPDPINQALLSGAIDTTSENAVIRSLSSQETVGTIKRGKKDDAYYLEAKLILPEIDRVLSYYNVWLVRPIPYDFISLGEMTTDEEGSFIFTWQAADKMEDYSTYSQIVITKQQYGGTKDPETKIASGEFGM